MNPEQVQEQKYLEKGAYHWNLSDSSLSDLMIMATYEEVLKKIDELNPKKVLDLGCGDGYLTSLIARDSSVFGIDFSINALSLAKQKCGGLEMFCADGERLPLGDESVDCVCAVEILEHNPLDKARKIMNEVYRVLEEGGSFVASVPCDNVPVSKKHYVHYNKKTLGDQLSDFSNVSIIGLNRANNHSFSLGYELTSNRYWEFPFFREIMKKRFIKKYRDCSVDEASTLVAVCRK